MKKAKTLLPFVIIILLAVVVMFFLSLYALPKQQAEINGGEIDLTGIDLASTIVQLPLEWDYYPGALYTPQDIADGKAGTPRTFAPQDEQNYQTGTYRAVLRLVSGESYALSAWSLDYATRIYVDGKQALDVGAVSDNASTFIPRIQHYTLPVLPQAETVEIVIQYANFVHADGGAMREMSFSTHENILWQNTVSMLPTYLLSGGLMLLAVFYLLQFFLSGRKEVVAFALCCLLLALRSQPFVLSLLLPGYNWYVVYKCLFIGTNLILPSFLLLTHWLHPSWFRAWVLPATFVLVGAALVAAVFIPASALTWLVTPLMLLIVPGFLYYFVRVLSMLPRGCAADRLSTAGLVIFFLTFMLEMLFAQSISAITRIGVGPLGMAASVVCYMLALGLRANENAVLLEQQQQRAESLARLGKMKTELLANVTHELKTPLTVISGYAQDTLLELSDEHPDLTEMAFDQRHILTEADRLDRMVNQLLDTAAIEGGRMDMKLEPTSLAALLRRMADAHFPMLNQNDNRIELYVPDGLPDISIDRERIEQVLLNLLSNAARHTNHGLIALELKQADGAQQVTVRDTGEGMDAGLQEQMFKNQLERRSNTSGRSGLGLYICKKIIDAHGGDIWIESEVGVGTAVTFHLPAQREETV